MTGQNNRIANVNTLLRLLNHFGFSPSPFLVPFEDKAENQVRTRSRVRHVDQAGRIVRAYEELHQMGLHEFHAGLFNFKWQNFGTAARHFHQASMYWSMTNQPALLCLASVAKGCAYYTVHDDEEAVRHYAQAQKRLESLQRHHRGPLLTAQDWRLRVFLNDLETVLEEAIGKVAEDLHGDFPAGEHDDSPPDETDTAADAEPVSNITIQDGPGRGVGDPPEAPPEEPQSERFVLQEGRGGQGGPSAPQTGASTPPPIVLPPRQAELAQENRELRAQLAEAREQVAAYRAEIDELRREMDEMREQMARFIAPRPEPSRPTTRPRSYTTEELLRRPPPLYVAPELAPVQEEETKPDMPVPGAAAGGMVPGRPDNLPAYLTPGKNQIYFRVEQKDVGRFLPDVRQGDLVLVDMGRRQPRRDDYIVLGDPKLKGSVIVDEPTHPQNVPFPLHVVQFVRETHTGRVHIISDNELHTYALEPDLLVGLVVGYFRTVV